MKYSTHSIIDCISTGDGFFNRADPIKNPADRDELITTIAFVWHLYILYRNCLLFGFKKKKIKTKQKKQDRFIV